MDEELLQRQAPQALEAEQSVLGSMLIDERCVPDVVGMLQPDDFYLRQNREIYETIYTMFNQNGNRKGHCQNGSVLADCGRISRACRSCTAGSRCAAGRIGTSGILLCRELHHRAHLLEMMGSLYSAALILSSSEI